MDEPKLMKKYLPLILLFAGILILLGAFLFVRGRKEKGTEVPEEETELLDLPINERPVVSLTPTADGHYLNLKVEKITFEALNMEYLLLYDVPGGSQQGVPGTLPLKGQDELKAELLLGSESSGKFRYDEGVEKGSLTLRFRNEEGQLLVKFETDFHIQTSTDLLTSPDAVFKYELAEDSDEFFVTMSSVGLPDGFEGEVDSGPYGVFTSSEDKVSGTVDAGFDDIYFWDGKEWTQLTDNSTSDVGIFLGSSIEGN
jgi:hypothetical protein